MSVLSRRVLVAEDDAVTRQFVVDTLSERGFEVVAAADGKDAIAAFLERGPFALLVADIVMPHTSGARVVERLCRYDPALKVLFISAGDNAPALAMGPRFLAKPFSAEVLLATVGELVGG